MLENVSELGVTGFYTYHFTEGNVFRPCATRIDEKDAIKATEIEFKETELILSSKFSSVLFGGMALGNFKLPIHLHPFMWQKRMLQDVNWYNLKNVEYIPFRNYRDGSLVHIPRDLSVYYEKDKGEGLTFSVQEGYAYDENIENAKIRAAMELIEKDVITLWWHRETKSKTVLLEEVESEFLHIKKELQRQDIEFTILDIENDLGVYVVVCILQQSEYPKITYGSAAHFDIKEAVKHAVFEAITCIAGLRYLFINFKQKYAEYIYPNFIKDNVFINLSDYTETLSLDTAISKYDLYYSYITAKDGYLVKAYCYELQSTLYCDTVPLTKRFFLASNKEVVIKENFPFI